MKKSLPFLWLVVMILIVFLCFNTSLAESYRIDMDVQFDRNMFFSTYDVDVFLDSVMIDTFTHGYNFTASFPVEDGNHTIWFYEHNNQSKSGSIEINTNSDATIKCHIHCYGSRIEVKDVEIDQAAHVSESISESLPEEQSEEPDAVDNPEDVETDKKDVEYKVDISQYDDASILNGRGFVDIPGLEPNYQNTFGYAAVYLNNELEENSTSIETPWSVDVYQKVNDEWGKNGALEHKSFIVILSQELTKKNGKEYQGYLEFQNVVTGETGYIDVRNYVTNPYWDFDSINWAIEEGYCIASYKQTSKFPPILKNGKQASVEDDTLILLPAKGTYFISVSDKINYSVLGIVFDKDNEAEKQYVFFNAADLTLVY